MWGAEGLSSGGCTQFPSSGTLSHRPLTLAYVERGCPTFSVWANSYSSFLPATLSDNSILLIVHSIGKLGIDFGKHKTKLHPPTLSHQITDNWSSLNDNRGGQGRFSPSHSSPNRWPGNYYTSLFAAKEGLHGWFNVMIWVVATGIFNNL